VNFENRPSRGPSPLDKEPTFLIDVKAVGWDG